MDVTSVTTGPGEKMVGQVLNYSKKKEEPGDWSVITKSSSRKQTRRRQVPETWVI